MSVISRRIEAKAREGWISRRALLKGTFAAGLGAGILGAIGGVASFLFPIPRTLPSSVLLGNVENHPVGSKTLFSMAETPSGLELL